MIEFKQWLENRELGRSLAETNPDQYGHPNANVVIYRALDEPSGSFQNMDYITLDFNFAKKHALHNADMNYEPAAVIKASVPATTVFEASNPGEYFYNGIPIEGQVVHLAKPTY